MLICQKTSGLHWRYSTPTPHELAYAQYHEQINELLAEAVAKVVMPLIQIDGTDRMIPRLAYLEIGLTT